MTILTKKIERFEQLLDPGNNWNEVWDLWNLIKAHAEYSALINPHLTIKEPNGSVSRKN